MRFSCDKCRSRYNVSDDKVRGKRLRIRCRKCRSEITIDGTTLSGAVGAGSPAAPGSELKGLGPEDARPPADRASRRPPASSSAHADAGGDLRAPPPPTPGAGEDGVGDGWHVVVGRDQRGPLSSSDMEEAILAGRVTGKTYVWREDVGEWKPAREVSLLAGVLERPRAAPPSTGEAEHVAPTGASRESSEHSRPAGEGGGEEEAGPGAAVTRAPPVSGDDSSAKAELDELFRDPFLSAEHDDDPGELFESSGTSGSEPEEGHLGSLPFGGDEDEGEAEPEEDPFAAELANEAAASAAVDPFSLVSGPDEDPDVDGAPRETTQMFILASGVKNQKSPLRIAAFVGGLAGLFAAAFFVVSHVGGLDLVGLVPIGSERREARAWESSGGETGLRDLLLGIRRDEEEGEQRHERPRAESAGEETEAERRRREELDLERQAVDADRRELLADLYQQPDRGAIAIRTRREGDDRGGVDAAESPIEPEVIHRRLAEAQPAFESCVAQEVRRNPRFEGGRVEMVLSVAPSGVVRRARIGDRRLDQAEVGRCITRAARRMMLPSFSGEDTIDIVVPLVLTAAR